MLSDKRYRLIACDIDGTILDANHKVCERLIKVVKYLQEQGYIFTLASARTPASVIKVAESFGIDNYIISLNGSFISNHKHEVLYSKTFPLSRVQTQLEQLDKGITRNYYSEFKWMLEYPNQFSDLEIAFHTGICAPIPKTNLTELNKITLIGEHDLLVAAQAQLQQDDSLLVGFSHTNFLEMSCKTISKFSGVAHYAKTLNIETSQVIAFGDGENDMPMLSQVGLGVAMANAHAHVKDSAHDVAGYHYEQGVALYLENMIAKNIL